MKLPISMQFLYTILLFSLIAAGVYGLSERVDHLLTEIQTITMPVETTEQTFEEEPSSPPLPTFDDEHFEDIDPCVFSNVKCKPETLVEQRTQEITEKILKAATDFYIDPDVALAIAQCESNLNPYAANGTSSAKGLYQFTDPTWREINAPGHQFDADENIRQFMIWYPIHPEWWVCE